MKEFKISIHPPKFSSPPIVAELVDIDRGIAKEARVIDSEQIDLLAQIVGKLGCVFCPSTFKDGIKSRETFEQSQLFVLSFDSHNDENAIFHKIIARVKHYGLHILFAYDTRKDCWIETKYEQFSMVFLNEAPIYDLKEAEAMQRALMMIFPEADKDCSVLKLNRGGNKLLYVDKKIQTINTEWLFMNMCLYLKDRYGSTNYRRKLTEYVRLTDIKLDVRNLPDISVTEVQTEDVVDNSKNGSNNFNKFNYDNKNDKNASKCIIGIPSDEKLSQLKYKINFQKLSTSNAVDGTDTNDTIDNISSNSNSTDVIENTDYTQRVYNTYSSEVLGLLSSKCKLYHEFESCSRRLSQRELLGLATNLYQIKSGQKKFNIVLSSEIYDDREMLNNWKYYFFFIRGKGSKPCTSFCPYHNICQHGRDILSTAKPKYHRIERIANWDRPLVDLEEAEEDFKEKFEEAVASNRSCWHIIKTQTALGKTETVLEFLGSTSLKVLIVVPTNRLKREVYNRAKKLGVDLAVSPSLHELEDILPADIWNDIQTLYNLGKSPMMLIDKIIAKAQSEQKITKEEAECVRIFRRYKRDLAAFFDYDGHAITTHRRLSSMNLSKYDLVIVDEDIIYSTVIPNRETVSISALKELKKELSPKDPLTIKVKRILKICKQIRKEEDSECFALDGIEYDKKYDDIELDINIPALCYANYFCYREVSDQDNNLEEDSITFVTEIKFPEDTKYIMLSATANKEICEYYFDEDNVRFYECKEAEITGKLYQYADKAMGRNSIRKDPSIIERIKKWTRVESTISFKEFHPYYTGSLHYGNCAGCDILKGCDIDVIGTPHQPEWIYKLFAYSLGYEVDDRLRPGTTVIHNGFRFRFMTYADETLRNIQFYMIESELEQAVGRARLLRCDCTVNLFSDFPLKQAELKASEYDNNKPEEKMVS